MSKITVIMLQPDLGKIILLLSYKASNNGNKLKTISKSILPMCYIYHKGTTLR